MSQKLSGPQELAKSVALDVASEPDEVGEFVVAREDDSHITDFRFASRVRGYENWQWSVTLFHDEELDTWTVDESSLIPAEGALLPPQWIPWKDRLRPEDLSVTDSLGTESDDPRIEQGLPESVLEQAEQQILKDADPQTTAGGVIDADGAEGSEASLADAAGAANAAETKQRLGNVGGQQSDDTSSNQAYDSAAIDSSDADAVASASAATTDETATDEIPAAETAEGKAAADSGTPTPASFSDTAVSDISDTDLNSEDFSRNAEDLADAAVAFHLTRSHVMTPEGRAETAKRWYAGQHGPKSLSTKTADGLTCEECGFLIPLQGELGRMFAVCANKWSPDDGKVVSLDHGCGEHSEIEASEASPLWVQSEPAYDDLHIDVVKRSPIAALGAEKLAATADEPASDTELPEVEILESMQTEVDIPATEPVEESETVSDTTGRQQETASDEKTTKAAKTTKAVKTPKRAAAKRKSTASSATRKKTARRSPKKTEQTDNSSTDTAEHE